MNRVLEKVKNHSSTCCVTIQLHTHRTIPENEKDGLLLKNMIKEAERRLKKECGDRAAALSERLWKLADEIDHRRNLESLVLFVSEEMAEYTRLPIRVEDKVSIGKAFAIRDIVRAGLRQANYYVLLLSKSNARLIEAVDDIVKREIGEPFPLQNALHPTQASEAAIANRVNNLGNTYFTEVSKEVSKVLGEHEAPLVVYSDSTNFHDYVKVAGSKQRILGNVTGNNPMNEKNYQVVLQAWPKVKELIEAKNRVWLKELKESEDRNLLVSDFNDIWKAIRRGRGRTLFIKQGYFQPARVDNNIVHLAAPNQTGEEGVIDDVIDVMLEKNLQNGGDAVFVSNGDLDQYQGVALTLKK